MSTASHTIGQLINPTVNRDAMRASAAGEDEIWSLLIIKQRVQVCLSISRHIPTRDIFPVSTSLSNQTTAILFHRLILLKYTQGLSSHCSVSHQHRSTYTRSLTIVWWVDLSQFRSLYSIERFLTQRRSSRLLSDSNIPLTSHTHIVS